MKETDSHLILKAQLLQLKWMLGCYEIGVPRWMREQFNDLIEQLEKRLHEDD